MFRFAITKFNLMTPGREDMDVEETSALSAAGDDKFAAVAAAVLAAVGDKEKGKTVDCCATRLRFEVGRFRSGRRGCLQEGWRSGCA